MLRAVRVRARRRLLPAVLVGGCGGLTLLNAFVPTAATELLEFSTGASVFPRVGRVVLVALGVLLIVTGRLLARGSRAAWSVAVVAAGGLLLFELDRRRISVAAPVAVAALVCLLATRSAFRLRFTARRLRRLWVPATLLLAVVAFALLAYRELDALRVLPLPQRLTQLLRTAVAAPGGLDVERSPVEAYVLALRAGLMVVLVDLMWALRRQQGDAPSDDVPAARWLALTYGETSAAPLLALPDNARLPLQHGRALAGLSVRNGVALSLGAPVGPPELREPALAEFVAYCEASGWVPAMLPLTAEQLQVAAALGFAGVKVGEEAFLDVAAFSTAGKRRANVRHSVTRARKAGVVVLRYHPGTRSAARDRQLSEISAGWLAAKGTPELGFTLGRFDLVRLADQEMFIAVIGEGQVGERVVGFVTWLAYAGGDAAVLDLMRRGLHCPPGVVETLIVDSLADFARRQRSVASLGGVPLAATTGRSDRTQQLLGWLYEHGEAVYAAKGLFRFKAKFDPRWEPIYLAYPRAADVPRLGLAALRSFLPAGAVRELLRRQSRPGLDR